MKEHTDALNEDYDKKREQAGVSNMPQATRPEIDDVADYDGPDKHSEATNYAKNNGRGDVGSEYAAQDPEKGNKGQLTDMPFSKNASADTDQAPTIQETEE